MEGNEHKKSPATAGLSNLVRSSGFEPPTPTMSRWLDGSLRSHSNQLSYERISHKPLLNNKLLNSEYTIVWYTFLPLVSY